jgi:lipoprotein-anchoring transpeptidase ErfK/SrfK
MGKKPHSHFLSLPPKLSKTGQKPSVKNRVWFIFIGIFLVFIISNLLIGALTQGVIFPGVSVAGKDLSFKTQNEARQILSSINNDKKFKVKVGNKTFDATTKDFGVSYDLEKTLQQAYSIGHSGPLPILGFFEVNRRGQLGYSYNVDSNQLKSFTSKVVSAVGKDPANATLKVNNGNLEIVPDQDGFRVDQKLLTSIIQSAIADDKDTNVVLEPQPVKASFLVSDISEAQKKASELLSRSVVLNYEGRQFIPDKNAMGYWLAFKHVQKEDGKVELQVDLSRDQIKGYLQSVANEVDIAPKNKKVNIRNGTSTVEQEGVNGRAILQDQAVDQIFSGLANGSVSVNLTSTQLAFKTETNRSVGLDYNKYIEINLSSQRLWAYQDNSVVFSTPITSGATGAGFPTVTGLFNIYAKERSRYLNGRPYGWDYNVYVDYWMPFYGGYGLHDADWRSAFGGQDYYYGGSHGCVNMPKSSAAFIYSWANIGTPVWVHY